MPPATAKPVIDMEVGVFVRRLRQLVTEQDCRLVWFLGAGCSVSSGIPTAAGLVRRWLPQLCRTVTGDEATWATWCDKEYPDCGQDFGSIYADVIERLFPTPRERQREIERLTGEKDPEIGYALLAVLMADDDYGPRLNAVLSTNFDDLVQDALYVLTRKKPLVVAHDSLAPFARHSRNRPLIVKVHGDAQLAPRNTPDETSQVGPEMSTALTQMLAGSGIVFCGYGGNDHSIAELLRSLPPTTFEWGTYWVGPQFPDGPVGQALRERSESTFLVPHEDFDSLMLQVAEEFSLDLPPLFDRFKKLEDSYTRSLKRRSIAPPEGNAAGPQATAESKKATTHAASRMSGTMEAYRVVSEARALLQDPERADALYRQAVDAAGSNALVLGDYALFLMKFGEDAERAEEYYQRAVDADPTQATNLGNYASFLHNVRKDPDRAEQYHQRALDADPSNADNLGNYAGFLFAQGKTARARPFLDRAGDHDPHEGLQLEIAFYRFAHLPEERDGALADLRRLVGEGVRSPRFNLRANVARAIEDGHPDPALVADLARVISDGAPAEILDRYEAWTGAGS